MGGATRSGRLARGADAAKAGSAARLADPAKLVCAAKVVGAAKTALAALAAAATLALATFAHADGGRVLASEPIGASRVTVFLAPSPLRVGAGDFSVLVQAGEAGPAVLDARVALELAPAAGVRPPTRLEARRGAARNQLLYAAEASLDEAGEWRLRVEVARGLERGSFDATFEVLPPPAPLVRYWPWLAVVPIAAAVFLLHQWLRDRQGSRAVAG